LKLWKTRVTALAFALAFSACSADDFFDYEGTLPIDDGASKGTKESLKVDGEHEARLELSTGVALTFPKGAVERDVEIGVERPTDSKAIELVQTLKTVKAVASAPYVLTPHGTQFQKDVKLEIPILNNKGRPLIAAYLKDENDREWKTLDTPVVEGDVAVVTLKHFSVIVLLDLARSGLEAPDAGAFDAGDDEEDAGTEDDASAEPDADSEDAGASAADAGVAFDAASTLDAGDTTPPVSDASAHVADAGTTQTSDAHTGGGPDAQVANDAGSTPDASAVIDTGTGGEPDSAYADASSQDPDSGYDYDSGYDSATPDSGCTPLLCEFACGIIQDGCGGELDCGDDCGLYGGTCNTTEHVCEYIGQ
jgi:hypothetical protein